MKGYTLIEAVISVALLAILLLGGTQLFYQNLRSAGLSDVDLNLNSSLRVLLSSIEKDIRYSQVSEVSGFERSDCLDAGVDGISGSSLSVIDLNGLTSTYYLDNDSMSSRSAQSGVEVVISPKSLKLSSLLFTWYCQAGISDKIKIELSANSEALGSGLNVDRSVSAEMILLNSGLN